MSRPTLQLKLVQSKSKMKGKMLTAGVHVATTAVTNVEEQLMAVIWAAEDDGSR